MLAKYYTKAECADQLKISIRKLERLVKFEGFPITRLGARCVRISAVALDRWLQERTDEKDCGE
jgi:excisionase family DNA binding protein